MYYHCYKLCWYLFCPLLTNVVQRPSMEVRHCLLAGNLCIMKPRIKYSHRDRKANIPSCGLFFRLYFTFILIYRHNIYTAIDDDLFLAGEWKAYSHRWMEGLYHHHRCTARVFHTLRGIETAILVDSPHHLRCCSLCGRAFKPFEVLFTIMLWSSPNLPAFYPFLWIFTSLMWIIFFWCVLFDVCQKYF